ncbi:uncharacterized protein LOC133320718 [Danaus plexippus]|uniref:uncharacterized protein LOC133320718 n=1 Tax=Danaus plexippus TaxID=13037 RepID=UPI002AB0A97C|nr:uncharacterized protein LOC133320718 [Danaus plexippus]
MQFYKLNLNSKILLILSIIVNTQIAKSSQTLLCSKSHISNCFLDPSYKYDVIIVGGGAAGCSLARTLADANQSVLLIERGSSRNQHKYTLDAEGAGWVVNDPSVSQLVVTSDEVRSHIGSVLSGGTGINFGVAIAESDDFLSYMELNEGVQYNHTLFHSKNASWEPYILFNHTENNKRLGADIALGLAGVDWPETLHVLTDHTVDKITMEYDGSSYRAECVIVHKRLLKDIAPIQRLEEISGARAAAGTIYATRILFPPSIRQEPLIDFIIKIIVDCEEKRIPLGNPFLLPACLVAEQISSCFRRVATQIYFTAEPKSTGSIKVLPSGLVETYISEQMNQLMNQSNLNFPFNNRQNQCFRNEEYCSEENWRPFLRPFKPYTQKYGSFPPVLPDSRNFTNLKDFVTTYMTSMWHWVGSAPMGFVVDSNFKVYGTSNLHIVDASVLNVIPRMNPTISVISLGRYAGLKIIQNS